MLCQTESVDCMKFHIPGHLVFLLANSEAQNWGILPGRQSSLATGSFYMRNGEAHPRENGSVSSVLLFRKAEEEAPRHMLWFLCSLQVSRARQGGEAGSTASIRLVGAQTRGAWCKRSDVADRLHICKCFLLKTHSGVTASCAPVCRGDRGVEGEKTL